jgi:hypothetical protein
LNEKKRERNGTRNEINFCFVFFHHEMMGRNVGHLERQSRRPPADNNKKDTRRVKRKHKYNGSAVHVIPVQAQAQA